VSIFHILSLNLLFWAIPQKFEPMNIVLHDSTTIFKNVTFTKQFQHPNIIGKNWLMLKNKDINSINLKLYCKSATKNNKIVQKLDYLMGTLYRNPTHVFSHLMIYKSNWTSLTIFFIKVTYTIKKVTKTNTFAKRNKEIQNLTITLSYHNQTN
jgi:hypothetical protein